MALIILLKMHSVLFSDFKVENITEIIKSSFTPRFLCTVEILDFTSLDFIYPSDHFVIVCFVKAKVKSLHLKTRFKTFCLIKLIINGEFLHVAQVI